MYKQASQVDLIKIQRNRIWSWFVSNGMVFNATIQFLINELPAYQRKDMQSELEKFQNMKETS